MNASLPDLAPQLLGIRQTLARRWAAFAPRERAALGVALSVLAAFLVWSAFVQPAWRSVRAAPLLLAQVDAQLQDVKRLAAESRELRATAPVSAVQASEALKAATARLGDTGKLMLQGERAVLALNNASTEGLRAWLVEARSAARARPVELQLQRAAQGYSGSVTVVLPGSQ